MVLFLLEAGQETRRWDSQLLRAQQLYRVSVVRTWTYYCNCHVSFVRRALAFFTLIIGRVFRVETLGLVKVGAVIMRLVIT